MSSPGPTHADRLSWRFVTAHLAQTLVMFLVIGGILFLSAGRWGWWDAWAFLIVYPMSAGMIGYDVSVPLVLGSWWGCQ